MNESTSIVERWDTKKGSQQKFRKDKKKWTRERCQVNQLILDSNEWFSSLDFFAENVF